MRTTIQKMLQGYVPATCPMKFNLLNFMGHVAGTKLPPNGCFTIVKRISSQESTCRWNISLKHVHATFSRVCTRCDIVPATSPRYMSPQCALHKFFCRNKMSLPQTSRVCPPQICYTKSSKNTVIWGLL